MTKYVTNRKAFRPQGHLELALASKLQYGRRRSRALGKLGTGLVSALPSSVASCPRRSATPHAPQQQRATLFALASSYARISQAAAGMVAPEPALKDYRSSSLNRPPFLTRAASHGSMRRSKTADGSLPPPVPSKDGSTRLVRRSAPSLSAPPLVVSPPLPSPVPSEVRRRCLCTW